MSITDGLMVYLQMNQATAGQGGNLTLPDASGNGNDGTLYNGQVVPDDVMGSCLVLDGSSTYATCSNGGVHGSDSRTLMMWAYAGAFNYGPLFDTGNNVAWQELCLRTYDSSNAWQVYLGLWCATTYHATLPNSDGAWQHYCLVFDGGHIYIYYNGTTNSSLKSLGTTLFTVDKPIILGKWDHSTKDTYYFNGKMANFRLYNRALSQDEILEVIQFEEGAQPGYEVTLPLDFDLYDDNNQPVLTIADDPADHNLNFTFKNTAANALSFPQLGSQASSHNSHFVLRFPPGALDDSMLDSDNFTVSDSNWSLYKSKDNGIVSIYFLCTDPQTYFASGLLTPNQGKALTLQRVCAAQAGGARGTRVELSAEQLTFQGDPNPLPGSRVNQLQILSHRGNVEVPLHIAFAGNGTVLNDGTTANTLTLRICNTSTTQTIALQAGSGEPAPTFVISVDAGDSSQDWTLATESQVEAIQVSSNDQEAGDPSGGQGTQMSWSLSGAALVTSLAPGAAMDVTLSKITTSHPSGLATLYVAWNNLPGYWDGQTGCPIQKGPLCFYQNNVGIGAAQPAFPLSLGQNNTGLSPESSGMHIYVQGRPLLYLDNNGQVYVEDNLAINGSTSADGITSDVELDTGDSQLATAGAIKAYVSRHSGGSFENIVKPHVAQALADHSQALRDLLKDALDDLFENRVKPLVEARFDALRKELLGRERGQEGPDTATTED